MKPAKKPPSIHYRPDFWNGPCNHITGYIVSSARQMETLKKYRKKAKQSRDFK